MMKRFFAALACVCLFAALLTVGALASDWQQINVGDERLDSYNGDPVYATTDASGDVTIEESFGEDSLWNVKWDGETLTLRDAYVINWYDGDLKDYLGSGIYRALNFGDIEIVLVGTNAVAGYYYGIYAEDHDLTFSGKGSLAVVCMDNTNSEAGIYADSVTVEGGSLTVYPGGSYYDYVYGMDVGELNVNGGSVSITGGTFGVNIRWISNTSGSVNISGGELTIDSNRAIWNGNVVVNGSADKTIVVVTHGEFEDDNQEHHISSTVTLDMGFTGGDYPMGHPSYFHSYVKGKLVTDASVSIAEGTLNLVEGDTGPLNATVEPEGTPITWTSSDPVVATVDANGVVTAHNRGTATITASAGTASDTCEVTVTSRGGDILIGEVEMSGTVENPVYATTDDDGKVNTAGANESNYNIKWDGTTLTLRNARVVTNATHSSGIECRNDGREVIIQIEGNNYVEGQDHGINYYFLPAGIDTGPITIDGSGTLTAVGSSVASYGICTNGLTINGGTINATGRDFGIRSLAPDSDPAGPITINAGTVNARAAGSTYTRGINAAGGIDRKSVV